MQPTPHPFRIAIKAILLAIGIPAVAFMFSAVRTRQLQSTSNPRWAEFSKQSGPRLLTTGEVDGESDSRSGLTRVAELVSDKLDSDDADEVSELNEGLPRKRRRRQVAENNSDTMRSVEGFSPHLETKLAEAPDQIPMPGMQFSGTISGRLSVEAPLVLEPLSTDDSVASESELQKEYLDSPPIIFRPVDDEHDDSTISSAITAAMTRFESELSEVKRRLDQLVSQQRDGYPEKLALENRILDAITHLDDRMVKATDLSARESTLLEIQRSVAETQKQQVSGSKQPRDLKAREIARSNHQHESSQDQTELDKDQVDRPGPEPTPNSPAPESAETKRPIERQRLPVDLDESDRTFRMPIERPEDEVIQDHAKQVPSPATIERNREVETSRLPEADIVRRLPDPIRITRTDPGSLIETYSIDVLDADIRLVFAKLSEAAHISIVSSPEVIGNVSLNLHNVSMESALKAILKSRDYVVERSDGVLIVRTAFEVARLKPNPVPQPLVRIYRPNYVTAAEISRLIEPLLSPNGRISVTSPSASNLSTAQTSYETDASGQRDTVIVQETSDILERIDRIVVDLDVAPLQVNIEAKILCVRLSNKFEHGIDLAALPCQRDSSNSAAEGGLKHANLACTVPMFINSIERLADTSVVTSQRIQVLNKHRAEMLIGDRIGYQSKAGGEIQFMEAGTRLILRPSISADGLIRMEIHPERSSVKLAKRTRLPQQNTAEMTTQVLIRDGATIAIGGLIAEQGIETTNRLPSVNKIPVVGFPFRNRQERQQRTELIVLVTPRIVVDSQAEAEGACLQNVTEQRAIEFRGNQRSPNRINLARAHYEQAISYLRQGNYVKARQQIDASLQHNKADLEALHLRDQINQYLAPVTR